LPSSAMRLHKDERAYALANAVLEKSPTRNRRELRWLIHTLKLDFRPREVLC
jgi:hypothetical protein